MPSNDLKNHSLGSMIANGTQIVLSTDAHSVMSTDLGKEYKRSADDINEVLAGVREIQFARGVKVNYKRHAAGQAEALHRGVWAADGRGR
jgi:hypothetical protein